ncbi:MAG: SRPBCC family protein [Paracoccaceae bacterium]
MKFDTREDIEMPIEALFARISDFEGYERAAMRRGAEVVRVDDLAQPGEGMRWKAAFDMRGKRRDIEVVLSEFDAPNNMVFDAESQGLDVRMLVDLVALSRARTRLSIAVELAPKTLSARLLVQSLKLARGNISKRFKLRVADFAKEAEDRHRRSA